MSARRATCLALALAMTAVACTPASHDVSRALGRAVADPDTRRVRIAELTAFDWDAMHLFEPYASRTTVCAALKLDDAGCARSVQVESQDDGEMTLAFVKAGRVVHVQLHRRSRGDFSPVPEAQPIAKAAAVFEVQRAPGGRVRLTWVGAR